MIFAIERAAKYFGIEPDVFCDNTNPAPSAPAELEQMELPLPEASDDEPDDELAPESDDDSDDTTADEPVLEEAA